MPTFPLIFNDKTVSFHVIAIQNVPTRIQMVSIIFSFLNVLRCSIHIYLKSHKFVICFGFLILTVYSNNHILK